MSEIQFGNAKVQATVIKVRAGQEEKALQEMTRDGVNNVAFKVDGDTFIASAQGMRLDGLKAWDVVGYAGRTGHVLQADKEELEKGAVKKWGLIAGGVGAVGMTLGGLGLGALFSAMPGIGEFAIFAGVGTVLGGLAGSGFSALTNWWNGRQAKTDRLKQFEG